jgi:hypothetical protein
MTVKGALPIEKFSQERQTESPENVRQGQAIPLRIVPQTKPEASKDCCSLVLP